MDPRGLGLCKKALNLAIENKSIQTFEEILQEFIKVQMNTDQHNDTSSEAEAYNIANLLQHKGKRRPANKRYLSAIKNNKNENVQETLDTTRKRNKKQYSICKS